MLTFRSAFLLIAVEFILDKGLEFIKGYSEEHKAEVENFVKKIVPGEEFDAIAWGFLQAVMPKLFEIAETLVDKIDGQTSKTGLILNALKGAGL